jgi:hypothetical protein
MLHLVAIFFTSFLSREPNTDETMWLILYEMLSRLVANRYKKTAYLAVEIHDSIVFKMLSIRLLALQIEIGFVIFKNWFSPDESTLFPIASLPPNRLGQG